MLHVFQQIKDYMTENILHRVRRMNANPDMEITTEMHNEALIMIEDMCLMMSNKALAQIGMPAFNA